MKKLSFLILSLMIAMSLAAQMPDAITINPPDATAYDELTLIFDPEESCSWGGSLSGLPSIAIHSGVTLLSGQQWQFIIEFNGTGANGQATTLMPTWDGRFSITYTPSEFYGLTGDTVTHICAVFNNGTNWNQDGRDFNPGNSMCMDFYIPINSGLPHLTEIDPQDGSQGDTLSITIYGLNTHFLDPDTELSLSKDSDTLEFESFNASSDTSILAQLCIPENATAGLWDVNVENPQDGLLSLYEIFNISYSTSLMPAAITIEPPYATAYDEMTLIFDPGESCFQNGSLAWQPSIAMQSGVTLSNGQTYQYFVAFDETGANGQSPILEPTGDGRFAITYIPNQFYGFSGEVVTQICAVFNNGTDWSEEGFDFLPNSPYCTSFYIPINYGAGQIIHVPGDYPTIQEAINAAMFCDTVLVEAGTYLENIDFNGKNITVASWYLTTQDTSYISQTIIDGNLCGTVVKFVTGEDPTAVLCGFTIKNGSSDADGGGIYCESSSPTIKDCHIILNTAVDGGGISCQYGASPSLSDCVIKWNTATLDGGGLYNEGSCSTTVSNCTFDENWAGDEGGGIYYETNCHSTISGCDIINNEAVNYGGGICCYDSFITLEGNILANNICLGRGGGINANNSSLIIDDTDFSENEGSVHGGAFFYYSLHYLADYSEINFSNCMFVNNTTNGATAGVFIVQDDSDESIIDVSLDNCTFSGNSADRRSAMYICGEDISFNISNCIFDNNTATTYVAGVSLSAYCRGSLINCLFSSNNAAIGGEDWNSGGASVWSGADVDFINCTFVDNTAAYGAGLTVGGGGIASSINCIYWGNTNNQIALSTYNNMGGILNISYSALQYGIDSVNISALSTLIWGDGNMDADPLFIGSGDDPFALQDGSPCTNSGIPDTSGLNLPELDLAGHDRVFGGRIEMGAYENQNSIVGIRGISTLSSMQLKVYPNPCSGAVHLRYQISDIRYKKFELYSVEGVLVKTLVDEISQPGEYELEFDVSDLPAGLYFMRMQAGDYYTTGKVVVIR